MSLDVGPLMLLRVVAPREAHLTRVTDSVGSSFLQRAASTAAAQRSPGWSPPGPEAPLSPQDSNMVSDTLGGTCLF